MTERWQVGDIVKQTHNLVHKSSIHLLILGVSPQEVFDHESERKFQYDQYRAFLFETGSEITWVTPTHDGVQLELLFRS